MAFSQAQSCGEIGAARGEGGFPLTLSAGCQQRQKTKELAQTLKGYKLASLDGEIGKVKEFYFDDRH